jgi:hypothetical protein
MIPGDILGQMPTLVLGETLHYDGVSSLMLRMVAAE